MRGSGAQQAVASTPKQPAQTVETYTTTLTGGAFSGATRIIKQGEGILVLPNVTEKHTGETNVWQGTLMFDGKMEASPVWLNRHTTLISNGGQFMGGLKADYNATIYPGGKDNVGAITASTLELGFGSRIVIDGSNGQLDKINANTLTVEAKTDDVWKEFGPRYKTPVIQLNYAGTLEAGTYELGSIGSVNGDVSDLLIEGIGNSLKASLAYQDGKLLLVVEGMREAGQVTWNGISDNSIWQQAVSENFLYDGQASYMASGDDVVFDDNAASTNVVISGAVSPKSVTFNNETKHYTLSGDSIVGMGSIIKNGNGNVIFNNWNHIGSTVVNGGKLTVAMLANNAGQDWGSLGSASSPITLNDGTTLVTNGTIITDQTLNVSGETTIEVPNGKSVIFNKAIKGSGAIVNKTGAGSLELGTVTSTFAKLVVKAGTVTSNYNSSNQETLPKTVEFQGGTLTENTSTSYGIYIPSGKSGRWNLVDRGSYGNKITGEGTLTIYCPVVVGSGWNATRTQIQGNWSEFKGTIKPAVHSSDTRFTLDNANGLPLGTLDIANGIEVQNSGRSFTIGKLSGTGSLGGVCSFSNSGGAAGNNVWKVGNEESWRWGGSVVGNGTQFVKIGSGKVVVSGVWTNTGAVTIQEGELNITSTASLGTGTLTVAKDAILSGVTTSSNTLKNSAYTINGTLQVGVTTSSYSGIMNFGSKNVSFSTGSTLVANVLRAANNNTTGGIYMGQINRLTMNGTIVVSLYKSYTPQVGDSIVLWDAVSFSGNPQFDLPATYEKVNSETNVTETFAIEWDTSSINKGILRVAGITNAIKKVAVDGQAKELNDVYNVQGQLVKKNAQSLVGLPKGIYFWQGRKVVVK